MLCAVCGHPLGEGARFCGVCGATTAAPSGGFSPPSGGLAQPAGGYPPPPAAPFAPPPPPEGGYPPPPGAIAPPTSNVPPGSFGPWPQAPPARPSRAPLVLALLAVAALSAAVVFGWRWYQRTAVLNAVVEVEKRWNEANIKGDRQILQEVLSERYHHEEKRPDGTVRVDGKRDLISGSEAKPGVQRWQLSDVRLAQYSGDRAVLSGVFIEFGEAYEKRYDFTDTFALEDGRWRAVDSQWSARSTVTR